MTFYKSSSRINGFLFSYKFHPYKRSVTHKFPFPILFLFTHITTCYCKEVASIKSSKIKTVLNTKFEQAVCKRQTFLTLFRNNSSVSSTFIYQPMTETENRYPNLEKIGILNNNNILIKDKENVEGILSSLFRGSFDNLQLVVDFDYTITRGRFSNEDSQCSWGILDNSSRMPPFYRQKALEFLQRYYPIEVDPVISETEKIPHMREWYNNIAELLKQCRISKKILSHMVAESNVKFREDADKLFQKLKDEDVPMLIFSAGMGDVLEHVLRHFEVYSENVKVVSNFFKYNEEGVMVGFEGDLIHMFNKNENAIHSSEYFDRLRRRSNVILMGDSLGDIKMAVGVPKSSNILKIGFFNHNTNNERINSYLDAFDVVLVRDQSMTVVNAILAQMKR